MTVLIADFQERLESLPTLLESLRRIPPVPMASYSTLPRIPAVYVIWEGAIPLYTGRTKNLRQRMANHRAGQAEKSAFAFRLAREKTGKGTPSYRTEGSRKSLMQDENFRSAMQDCVMKIEKMGVGYVEIEDSVTQLLFEVYCALALKTPYNDFKTT